jgi:hypothetical protein
MPQRLRPAVTDPVTLMFSHRLVEVGDLAGLLTGWTAGRG